MAPCLRPLAFLLLAALAVSPPLPAGDEAGSRALDDQVRDFPAVYSPGRWRWCAPLATLP